MGKREEERFQRWYEETWLPMLKPELHNSAKAILNDDTARTELMNGFLRQEDYSKKTTELAQTRQELDAERLAWRQKEDAYNQWYSQANAEYQAKTQKLASLEAALHQTGYQPGTPKVEQTEEQKQLIQMMGQLAQRVDAVDRGTYNAAVNLSSLAYKAAREGYSFDPAKVVEISQTQNLPLDRAFTEFIAPEREARDKAKLEKEKEELREQIRREILSNRPGPDNFGSEVPAVVDQLFSDKKPESKYDRVNEATKLFYEGYSGN